MSLKLFFNRKGPVVRMIFVAGILITLNNLVQTIKTWDDESDFLKYSFLVYCFLGALVFITKLIPWYPKEDRGEGIEFHFERTTVPTTYIFLILGILHHIIPFISSLYILFSIFFALILKVNIILIYFHFKDKSTLSPAYFAKGMHLKE